MEKSVESTSNNHQLQLRLSYRPPYDWPSIIQFLQARAIPGVEAVSDTGYRRTVQIDEVAGIIEIQPVEEKSQLLFSIPTELSKGLIQTVEQIRHLFDLNADPTEITNHLKQDQQLAATVQSYPGLRVPGAWDSFEIAVRAILGQQISVKAATTLSGRVAQAWGEPIAPNGDDQLAYIFPSAERLAAADLSGLGIIPQRANAIQELARAVASGSLSLGVGTKLDDAIEQLTALPGIGPWTAHYVAMRALGEPDAFPAGDLVLRRAAAMRPNEPLTEAQLRRQAEQWRPWRAYAAMYLWKQYAALENT